MNSSYGISSKKTFSYRLSSRFLIDKVVLWDHITSMLNVNKELMPYLRMTYPSDRKMIKGSEKNIQFGETLFVSVLLLFGLIPIDLHWLRLDLIIEGNSFHENSTTLLNKYWKHKRILIERPDGIVQLTDELEFLPRIPLMGYFMLPFVKHIFQHRHSQLKKTFQVA